MITANVIQRTFRIKYKDRPGTCFIIDRGRYQFLITAKHIVEEITNSDIVELYYAGEWKSLHVDLIGHGKGNIDLSVLAGNFSFSVDYDFPTSTDGLSYGHDVYFLGFPSVINIDTSVQALNNNFPFPITRKAVVCGVDKDYILLDGHGNKGFSGGPVIFKPINKDLYSVAGVVSKCADEIKPVYETELQAKGENIKPIGYYRENASIVTVYLIKHAIDLIDQYLTNS